MLTTKQEVMDFVEQEDVKFIRLAFCDIFGVQKNLSVMPNELEKAFDSGISFDSSAIKGFSDEAKSDLFLVPDPTTMSVLPWRPSHGRVIRFFCDIKNPDGTDFELDCRKMLKKAVEYAAIHGVYCYFGTECEFYLFKTDENGNATKIPFDSGSYMDIAPLDKGENVRREICLTLEEMGIIPEKSHHEEGPGQNEIDFRYSDTISAADNRVTFKTVVDTIAHNNGLYASFSPKPVEDKSGSGMHINVSVSNINGTDCRNSFMAGILRYIKDITLFLNPTEESYKRLGKNKAPKYITWSEQNRSQLIRIPAENSRIELRSPDCMANPYIAFALIIYAGLEGVKKNLSAPEPQNVNLYKMPEEFLKELNSLPDSLEEAIKYAEASNFLKRCIPEKLIKAYRKEN